MLAVEALEDRNVPSFLAPVDYPTGDSAWDRDIAVGDFNNDAIPDLVTPESSSNSASVRLGNGDGTFQAAQDSPTGRYPIRLTVGDFNGDGKLDIVTANLHSRDVSVLLGGGDGAFQSPKSFILPNGQEPVSLAAGDFNRDGKLDLAVGARVITYGKSHKEWPSITASAYVNVLLGGGDGSLLVASTTRLSTDADARVAVGDFNGDGQLDVLAATYDRVYLQSGNGDGTLQKPARLANVAGALAVADLNGDTKLDFVVANALGNSVSVFLGNGNGTFQAAQSYAVGTLPGGPAVGDFDRDGNLDLVTANAGTNDVSLLLGNGDGTFGAAQNFATCPNSRVGVASGDFDGNGFPDLVTANYEPDVGLSILLNDGVW
jgi:uncharacterized protein (DUF2141 family)